MMTEPLLKVLDLQKHFPITSGIFRRKIGEVKAVDGVSFDLEKGKIIALVGESGSGKTTVGKLLVRIYRPTAGSIIVAGQDIAGLGGSTLKKYRRKAQMVFQDPTSSLNPRRRVIDIVADPLKVHRIGSRAERHDLLYKIMDRLDLPKDYLYRYPHSLSGGQKQRVGIARAIIMNPDLVVLDEPTASLDVSVQANIISLLRELREEYKLTYVFISHNLSLVRNFADSTIVMYLGRVMEMAATTELFSSPMHPYTIALLSSIPTISDEERKLLPTKIRLEGEIPSAMRVPTGCRFASRCPMAFPMCSKVEPKLTETNGRLVRCHLFDDSVQKPDQKPAKYAAWDPLNVSNSSSES
jgi:oligopeptide transport system ATP-binding protein